jgi:Protein of unknown function (DUF4231)
VIVNSITPLERITQQSSWYGENAQLNRRYYQTLKATQIVFAAAIPVVAVSGAGATQRWVTAILGSLIGIIEGLIQLGQYQQNWLLYRATREALKREDFLYSAKAGPYSDARDADALFVERSDSIISGESLKWLATQEKKDTRS